MKYRVSVAVIFLLVIATGCLQAQTNKVPAGYTGNITIEILEVDYTSSDGVTGPDLRYV